MPAFSFRGFAPGSSVALSVAQSGRTASATVAAWEQGDTGSMEIQVTSPAVVTAPAGLFFEAVDIAGFNVNGGPGPGQTYDPSFHEIHFTWTVSGGPALAPFTVPENMLDGWNRPHIAYGKKVAFHFPEPGTYRVDVVARDSDGNRGTASASVSVIDADEAYPGTRTVCFSNAAGESWSGEKPGCLRATSFAQLQTSVNNANGPLRILFKRGQTVPQSQMGGLLANNAGEWLNHVGAWGSGAKPVIECPPDTVAFRILGPSVGVTQFTCENIFFRGDWDARTQMGKQGNTPFSFNTNPNDCFYTISRCDFSGLSSATLSTNSATTNAVVVAECDVTNWQDYGIYISNEGGAFAVIGSRLVQNVDAGNGHPFGKNWMFNQHGPLRVASAAFVYVAISDFFSRNGWSSLPPDQADQPCMRLHQSGLAGASTNVSRVVCEGGGEQIALSTESQGFAENPGNHLVDKALLIASPKTWEAFILAEYGGTTIRNVVGVQLASADYHTGNGWQGAVKLRAQNPVGGNLDGPMRIYSNSWINLRGAAADPGDSWPSVNDETGFADVTDENNVVFAPNLDTPVNPGLPLGLSGAFPDIQPRYKGVQYYPDAWTASVNVGNVPNGSSVSFPYPTGTSQAYWQARAPSDVLDVLRDGNASGGTNYHAADNAIQVTFSGSAIVVTNTSGTAWTRATKELKLDRKSSLPALPPAYSQTGLPVPVPRPTTAIGSGGGLMAQDDFEETSRTTPTAGAFAV